MTDPMTTPDCQCCMIVCSLLKHSGTCNEIRNQCTKCQKTSALLLFHCSQCVKKMANTETSSIQSLPGSLQLFGERCGIEVCDKLRIKFISKVSPLNNLQRLQLLWEKEQFWQLVQDHLRQLFQLSPDPIGNTIFEPGNIQSIGGVISGMIDEGMGSFGTRPLKRPSIKKRPVRVNLLSIIEHPDEDTADHVDGLLQTDIAEESSSVFKPEPVDSVSSLGDTLPEPTEMPPHIPRIVRKQPLSLRLNDRGVYHSIGFHDPDDTQSDFDYGLEVQSVPIVDGM